MLNSIAAISPDPDASIVKIVHTEVGDCVWLRFSVAAISARRGDAKFGTGNLCGIARR
jgi:hypothetical protein